MNILVTGAMGRLGKRLCPYLASRGHTVFSPSRAEVDWAYEGNTREYLDGKEIDLVFGLAAYTNVPRAEEEKGACKRDTVTSAENVAKWCKENNVRNVYISSDYVIPILMNQRGGYYAKCKKWAEEVTVKHSGQIVRLAFVTPEQVSSWSFVNAYTLSHRWWVEDAARALVRYVALGKGKTPQVANLGPSAPTTPYEMLLERYPEHPALGQLVRTPQEMQGLIGYSAPADTRFFKIFEV